jgi:hypothetical protein
VPVHILDALHASHLWIARCAVQGEAVTHGASGRQGCPKAKGWEHAICVIVLQHCTHGADGVCSSKQDHRRVLATAHTWLIYSNSNVTLAHNRARYPARDTE